MGKLKEWDIEVESINTLRVSLWWTCVLIIHGSFIGGILLAADSQPSTAVVALNNLAAIITAFALLIGAIGVAWSKINTKLDIAQKAIESTAKAVDGQMEHFKQTVEATSELKSAVARLEGGNAGYKEGLVKAEASADKQADAVSAAFALPPPSESLKKEK